LFTHTVALDVVRGSTVFARGLVTLLLAAVLVPAAEAAHRSAVSLPLVPLPKSALPAASRALSLARDSGVDSNANAASNANGDVTAKQVAHLGRVTGYLLDYGTPFGDGSGVHEIQTEVERYKSAADAARGLAFWRREELDVSVLKGFGAKISLRKTRVPAFGSGRWAYVGSLDIKGLQPVDGVDAEFQDGSYLLDVSVSAGSKAAAERPVPGLARKLDRRLQLAVAGRLSGHAVALPKSRKPGPPQTGPKPARMVLTQADVGSPATVKLARYVDPAGSADQYAVSAYDLTMEPAGSFAYLTQEVSVGASDLEVKYYAAVAAGALAKAGALGKDTNTTPVDLSSAGDDAHGEIVEFDVGGTSVYEAIVILSRDRYLDFLAAASLTPLAASDVTTLAASAVSRLDAGVGG
jgi:hypothetical protein